jgi:hypothetical protein
MYTDSPEAVQSGASVPYAIYPGLNWIKDTISPHYNLRALDFDEIISYNKQDAIGLEDNAAIEITDGRIVRSLNGGGRAYRLHVSEGKIEKTVIAPELVL